MLPLKKIFVFAILEYLLEQSHFWLLEDIIIYTMQSVFVLIKLDCS